MPGPRLKIPALHAASTLARRSLGFSLDFKQVEDGRILDAASERLAEVRAERRQNMQELRRKLDEWARLLHSKGVSERPQARAQGQAALVLTHINCS